LQKGIIMSREKIADPNNLFIRSYVNGELRQDSNTTVTKLYVK